MFAGNRAALILHFILLAAVATSCREAPDSPPDPAAAPAPAAVEPEAEAAADTPPGTLPLKEIMAGLERDLAEVASGFWIEDLTMISAAATRVADHARVPPEQMARIQSTLGDEFPAFVQMDGRVHDAAVELAAAAESARSVSELLPGMVEIQEGCVSCHSAFRARVSEALAAPGL